MPETALLTALEKIEHVYDSDPDHEKHRIHLNLIVSLAVELMKDEKPADVLWESFSPWLWDMSNIIIKFGAYQNDGTEKTIGKVPESIVPIDLAARTELIASLERRRDSFYSEEKNSTELAPLTKPSTLFWSKSDPRSTDPYGRKHFKEFVINEGNRPAPVSQALNLNFCFSISNKEFEDIKKVCIQSGVAEDDLSFFAYLDQFEISKTRLNATAPKAEIWNLGSVDHQITCVKYKETAARNTFSAICKNLKYSDLKLEFSGGVRQQSYASWLKVNIDFEDWLASLKSSLVENLKSLEVFNYLSGTNIDQVPLPEARVLLGGLMILLSNRCTFTSKKNSILGENQHRLRLLTKVSAADDKLLLQAKQLIIAYENDLHLDESASHSQPTIDKALTKITSILDEVCKLLSLKNPLPLLSENDILTSRENFELLKKELLSPKGIATFLKVIYLRSVDLSGLPDAERADLKNQVITPDFGMLEKTEAKNRREIELIKDVLSSIEKERLSKDPSTIPAFIVSAANQHLVTALESVTANNPTIKGLFQSKVTQQVAALGQLVPESAAKKKGAIPSRDVQPVSFDIVEHLQTKPDLSERTSGVGILLRPKIAKQSWKCLNNCAIWAVMPNARTLVSQSTVVPVKLSKNGGTRQTTVTYNNHPITGRSAASKLAEAAQQKLETADQNFTDYIEYDLAIKSNINPAKPDYEVLPMLKYGQSYEIAAFVVDKGGALPVEIAESSTQISLLKTDIPESTKIPVKDSFVYQRHVGFAAPRFGSSLPAWNKDVRYLEAEVTSQQLFITHVDSQLLTSSLVNSTNTVIELAGLKFSKPSEDPIIEITLARANGKIACSLLIEMESRKITLAGDGVKTSGLSPVEIGSIQIFKLSDSAKKTFEIAIGIGDLKGNNVNDIDFGGVSSVTFKGEALENFQVQLSARHQKGTSEGLFEFQKGIYSDLDSGQKVGTQPNLFEKKSRDFILLCPDSWKQTGPKIISPILLHPPATSFENWDRWCVTDSRVKPGERKSVVSQYFKQISSNSTYTKNPDAEFAINDPACDEYGYIELVRVFPNEIFDSKTPSEFSGWFKYDRTDCVDAKTKMSVNAVTLKSSAELRCDTTSNSVEVSIPEGELWELRVYSCVRTTEFAVDKRCSVELAGERMRSFVDKVTNNKMEFYILSPRIIRIEVATESPLFQHANYDLLQSIRDNLEVTDTAGVLQVITDRSLWDKSTSEFHYLVSDIQLHWQSWHWDGKLLSPYPYGWTKEEQILSWEAKEFANKPESVHFTTSNKIGIYETKKKVFQKDLTQDLKADFYRFAITIKSRYAPLKENLILSTFSLLKEKKTCWHRHLFRSRWETEVPAPMVKIAIPLTNRFNQSRLKAQKSSPDLLVILNEPPFRIGGLAEKIVPEICRTSVTVDTAVNSEILEFGPDPLLFDSPPLTNGIPTSTDLWDSNSVGRRQFGFSKDLATDYPRFSASALVLPCPDSLHFEENGEAKEIRDFSWYLMKLKFRRVLDKEGCVEILPNEISRYNGYASEPTPETWVQYLPDSSLPSEFSQAVLKLKNKVLQTEDLDLLLSPQSVNWTLQHSISGRKNVGSVNQEAFSFFLLFTEEVSEADGITAAERYNSIFQFTATDKGEIVSAESDGDTEKLLKALPEKGYVRLMEIQTSSTKALKIGLKGKSLWDVLFLDKSANGEEDSFARITRMSQPILFVK